MGLILGTSSAPVSGSVAGTLARDAVATPHQLALNVESLGGLTQSATASVRVRTNSPQGSWSESRSLFRTQPANGPTPPWGAVDDIFAWTIFGLQPGTAYDVELTLFDGAVTDVRTPVTYTTKSLPAEPTGSPDVTIASGSNTATIQAALNGASPGDWIYFENGSYTGTTAITIPASLSGSAESTPTYITGQTRTGVILRNTTTNGVTLQFATGLDNVVLQDLSIRGDGADFLSDPPGYMSRAIYSTGDNMQNITIRRTTVYDVSQGIYIDAPGGGGSEANITGWLVYHNDILGTNSFDNAHFDNGVNYVWNDYGIQIPGSGHAVFANTIAGFGDTLSTSSGPGSSPTRRDRSQHFYWNFIENSTDDTMEFDYSYRHLTFYQNFCRNVINVYSVDPIYGGPVIVWGNVCVNVAETRLYKWNTASSGFFTYNNTYVTTDRVYRADSSNDNLAFYYQPNAGGSHSDVGYANNLHIKTNGGFSGSSGNDYVLWFTPFFAGGRDIHHNAWFPNGNFQIGDGAQAFGANLAAFQADQPAAAGIFENLQMFENDVITIEQPFATTITLGADYSTLVTTDYSASDFELSATGPRNQGIHIPGITSNLTESYTGAAPDVGAVVRGLTYPTFGDPTSTPAYAEGMADYAVRQLTGVYSPGASAETMEDVTPTGWINENNNPGRAFAGVISGYSGGAGAVVQNTEDGRLNVHGGGHNDSGNNGMYLYDPRPSSGVPIGWETLDITTKGVETQGTGATYTDGNPRSVHTYDAMCFARDRNLYFRVGGAIFEGNGGFSNYFWQYDPTAAIGSRWTQLTNYPGSFDTPFCCYDEATGKIFAMTNGEGHIYDIDAGTWSSSVGLSTNNGFDGWGGYDPTRNIAWWRQPSSGGGSRVYDLNFSTDAQVSSSALTFTGTTNIVSAYAASAFYDAALDRFWVFGGNNTANYDSIGYFDAADLASSPGSVSVTEVALSANIAATGFEEAIIGSYGRFLFVENTRLLYTVHRTDEAPWVIKLPDA